MKLVEYGSLTCPHCRHFAEDAVKPFVQRNMCAPARSATSSGPWSSTRPIVGVTLLARCAGPAQILPDRARSCTRPSRSGSASIEELSDAQEAELEHDARPAAVRSLGRARRHVPDRAAHGMTAGAGSRNAWPIPKRRRGCCDITRARGRGHPRHADFPDQRQRRPAWRLERPRAAELQAGGRGRAWTRGGHKLRSGG